MSATQPPPTPPLEAKTEAKRLLRVAQVGALATLDRASGGPLTTLVSVGSAYDGAPLFLLSTLAQHTKNLAADPRASLLLDQPAGTRRSAQPPTLDAQRPDRRRTGSGRPRALRRAQPEGETLCVFR